MRTYHVPKNALSILHVSLIYLYSEPPCTLYRFWTFLYAHTHILISSNSFKCYLHAELTSLCICPTQIFASELNIHVSRCLGWITGFLNLADWASFYAYSTKFSPQPFSYQLMLTPSFCLIRPNIFELSMTLLSFSP